MNLLTFFDVLLSLTFIFFIVSLFVSGIWEFIATIIQDKRSTLLRQSLQNVLSDPKFADLIYEHPLIKGQTVRRRPQFLERIFGWMLHRDVESGSGEVTLRPSYITANVFAKVLLGLLQQHAATPAPVPVPPPALGMVQGINPFTVSGGFNSIQQVSQWVNTLSASSLGLNADALEELKSILTALLQDSKDISGAIASIEKWYNAHMERVSGYYKQYSQEGIRWVSIFIVVAFNLDVISVTERLQRDTELRNLVVGQAVEIVQKIGNELNFTSVRSEVARRGIVNQFKLDSTKRAGMHPDSLKFIKQKRDSILAAINKQAKTKSDSLKQQRAILVGETLGLQQLPFGWATICDDLNKAQGIDCIFIMFKMFIGWLLMIAAVSFGAPFWFDLLVKFVNVRNVGKLEDTGKPVS